MFTLNLYTQQNIQYIKYTRLYRWFKRLTGRFLFIYQLNNFWRIILVISFSWRLDLFPSIKTYLLHFISKLELTTVFRRESQLKKEREIDRFRQLENEIILFFDVNLYLNLNLFQHVAFALHIHIKTMHFIFWIKNSFKNIDIKIYWYWSIFK